MEAVIDSRESIKKETKFTPLWWERHDLCYQAENLIFSGEELERIARSAAGPCFVYSADRITRNYELLREKLAGLGVKNRVLYAMKANRFLPVLSHLKSIHIDGIDVCSPGELKRARQAGFRESEISFTGTSVSNADIDVLAAHPEVWVNCDSLSSLRRLGERSRGRKIGLRINQQAGIAYRNSEQLNYGEAATKFGIYEEQVDDAFEIASHFGMVIAGLHFHAGCGYLKPQLEDFRRVLERAKPFIEKTPGLEYINIGGGLGVPIVEGDEPLDLDVWCGVIMEVFGDPPPFAIWIEPGDFLVKDAGILVLEINTVEEKGGCNFVGVNGGFNLHVEPAFYDLPLEIASCHRRTGDLREVAVVGNINEALDVFSQTCSLPPVVEGDYLALLNAGGYGSAMSSNHCMRGEFSEYLVFNEMKTECDTVSERNKDAWDSLYKGCDGSVWGMEPIPFVREFIDKIGTRLSENAHVLDAATGEGRHLPLLLNLGAAVHACDASVHALEKFDDKETSEVQKVRCDLEKTPFESNFFEFITLIDTVETLPNADVVLAELCRILKPNGYLLCNIPGEEDGISDCDMTEVGTDEDHSHFYQGRYFYHFYTEEQAKRLVAAAGFEVKEQAIRSWTEEPHPGFRENEHEHTSRVFLLQKREKKSAS